MFKRRKAPKPDPEEVKAAMEKANAAAKAAAEEAAADAKKAAALAERLKQQKAFCTFLIIFCLHYHACSVESIAYVLRSYELEGTRDDIVRCIRDNQLLTYKNVLPGDERELPVFSMNQTPEFTIERIHSKQFKLKMIHDQIPAIQSPALILSHGAKGSRIATEVFRNHIVFSIFSVDESYPWKPLVQHYTRCMRRAIGLEYQSSGIC